MRRLSAMLLCEVADFFERRANTTATRPFAMGIDAIRRMKSGDVTCSIWSPAGNSSLPGMLQLCANADGERSGNKCTSYQAVVTAAMQRSPRRWRP